MYVCIDIDIYIYIYMYIYCRLFESQSSQLRVVEVPIVRFSGLRCFVYCFIVFRDSIVRFPVFFFKNGLVVSQDT